MFQKYRYAFNTVLSARKWLVRSVYRRAQVSWFNAKKHNIPSTLLSK